MMDSLFKNIRFDFDKIRDILDNCSQLEKVGSNSDTSLIYFDTLTGIKYTILSDQDRLEIQSGSPISGKFEETEYILKVLRAIVQKS